MNANDVLTALPPGAIERKGRWRSFRRSLSIAVVLGLLALPPALVACGGLEPIDSTSTTMPPFEASALIALTLLIGMALTLLVSIYRCWELVDTSRGPAVLSGLATVVLVFGGAAWLAHVVCDVLLWLQIRESITPAPILVLDHWFWITLTCLGSGLVVMLGLAMVSSPGFWWRRDRASKRLKQRLVARLVPRRLRSWLKGKWHPDDVRYWQSVVRGTREPGHRVPIGGTIICCSGGGIRSASFSLGGMQALQMAGEYRKAAAVVGVSGGGYIATAMHVLRWRSGMESGGAGWGPLTSEPFAPDTEEFNWLRRHTRYLFDNLRMGTLAALTVVFGMAVNLFWCTAVLGALAWWAGWLFLASGGLEGYWTTTAAASAYRDDWALLDRVWVLPLVGVGLFVLERIVNRVRTLPAPIREAWRTAAVVALWSGLVLVTLLLGLPWLMATIHNSEFFGRGTLGELMRAVGLRDDDSESLKKTASGSLAAIAAAVLAIVRLGVAKIPDKATANKASQLLTRVTTLLKHVVAAVGGSCRHRHQRPHLADELDRPLPCPARPAGRLATRRVVRRPRRGDQVLDGHELDVAASLLSGAADLRLHPGALR